LDGFAARIVFQHRYSVKSSCVYVGTARQEV